MPIEFLDGFLSVGIVVSMAVVIITFIGWIKNA